MTSLADHDCAACRGDEPPMTGAESAAFLAQVKDWEVVDDHHLRKRWTTRDFVTALALANRLGEVAEEMGHHPVLEVQWGQVEARVWTHKIDGLHVADFVLAARFDRAAGALRA